MTPVTVTVQSVGLLLAAGAGQRFDAGVPGRKLEAPMAQGSVFSCALDTLGGCVDAVVVVMRGEGGLIAQYARQAGARIVVAVAPERGMGHSLADGVHAIDEAFAGARWLVVALADMPWLQAATVNRLLDTARVQDRIVQPVFLGQGGHPVVFPRRYWPELMACQGDSGARDLLRRHALDVLRLDVTDAGVCRDVDVPQDLVPIPP